MAVETTVDLVRYAGGQVLHVLVGQHPDSSTSETRCGLKGTPIQIEHGIDRNVVRLGSYRVCSRCLDH